MPRVSFHVRKADWEAYRYAVDTKRDRSSDFADLLSLLLQAYQRVGREQLEEILINELKEEQNG